MAEHVEACRCRVVVHDVGSGVDLHRCALHQAAPEMRLLLEEMLLLASARGRQYDDQLQDLARRAGAALGVPAAGPDVAEGALDRLRQALRSED
jgi:hypothetical protein